MMWCVGAGCACVRVLALLAAVMGDRLFAPRISAEVVVVASYAAKPCWLAGPVVAQDGHC